MTNNEEVIDVDVYDRDRQRNSESSLKSKYQKLKEENTTLEIKLNKISHANDALHRQVFEQNQQGRRVAQLLGFDNMEAVEAHITAGDPWISGGHNRILLLEEELARHVESGKEAQVSRANLEKSLVDAEAESQRLLRQRDVARRSAERQASDNCVFRKELQKCQDELHKCQDEVQTWRNEVNNRLPEMQALIQELRTKVPAQSGHPRHTKKEKENESGLGERHGIAPHDIAKNSLFYKDACTPPSNSDSEAQYYKKKYELLRANYDELLTSKRKVSQRYFEDLKKWKEFKNWIVREESQNGKITRRALRGRKVLEDIGPTDRGDSSVPTPSGKDGLPQDWDVTVTNGPQNFVEENLEKQVVLPTQTPCPHTLHPLSLDVNPPRPASVEEIFMQPSNTHPAVQDSPSFVPILRPSSNESPSKQPPLSQASVTQASSTPASPLQETALAVSARGSDAHFQSPKNDTYGPLNKMPVLKQESKGQLLLDGYESISKKQDTPRHEADHAAPISETNVCHPQRDVDPDEPPKVLSDLPLNRPPGISSLPPSRALQATKFEHIDAHATRSVIRRASTVLALDTPPRAGALVRHHSSPADSPHVRSADSSLRTARRDKRKATDMDDTDEDVGQGDNSDPFVAGPSKSPGKPATFQTRRQMTTHFEMLGKQTHKEYMAKYMPYKGRGRYSDAKAASEKTVNAEFEINLAQNSGVNYQFDAVVRDKARRKNLEASDCECCRDYYEAIGPLPPRLQPPKWRSPSRSQHERLSRPCRHQNKSGHNDTPTSSVGARAKAIELHKHDISRHRHDWAPPTTPPSYWHIGFPNTQEVEDINRQANDMHARKLQRIEAEANSKNGRYRRRE